MHSDETGILTFSSNGLSSIDTQIQIKDNTRKAKHPNFISLASRKTLSATQSMELHYIFQMVILILQVI